MMLCGVSLVCGLCDGMKCVLLGSFSRLFLLCMVFEIRNDFVYGWNR